MNGQAGSGPPGPSQIGTKLCIGTEACIFDISSKEKEKKKVIATNTT